VPRCYKQGTSSELSQLLGRQSTVRESVKRRFGRCSWSVRRRYRERSNEDTVSWKILACAVVFCKVLSSAMMLSLSIVTSLVLKWSINQKLQSKTPFIDTHTRDNILLWCGFVSILREPYISTLKTEAIHSTKTSVDINEVTQCRYAMFYAYQDSSVCRNIVMSELTGLLPQPYRQYCLVLSSGRAVCLCK
jgi:hypothetical protein